MYSRGSVAYNRNGTKFLILGHPNEDGLIPGACEQEDGWHPCWNMRRDLYNLQDICTYLKERVKEEHDTQLAVLDYALAVVTRSV